MKIKFLQNIIDKIRSKPNPTKLLVYKLEGYKKAKNIRNLILGSSHLANGYSPINYEYNFAMPSQDLYYAYHLYEKLNRNTIKNIIVAISVFTPGLSIVKTKCAHLCVPYKLLFNIDYQDKMSAKEKKLYDMELKVQKEIKKYQKNIKLDNDYRGDLLKYPKSKFNKKKAINRALKHYKNNQREDSQIKYLEKIIIKAKENNQNVFIIFPPVTKNYRIPLPSKNELFKDIYNLEKKYDNSKILNYYDKDLFEEKECSNEDHLNKIGAIKLSRIIRKDIESENK